MSGYTRYINSIRYPNLTNQGNKVSGFCYACGGSADFKYYDVISNDLAKQWNINSKLRKAFSQRESMHCSECRSSLRLRSLSKAITYSLGKKSSSLKGLIKDNEFKNLKIAEINACGDLHNILKDHKELYYSEYAPKDPSIKKEDMMKLSYPDNYFDIVLTSDTFEHIPDFNSGLKEVHRVLKPRGKHIFTIPTISSRRTVNRVNLKGKNLLEPSYHGAGEPDNLVVNEFGVDVINKINKNGFGTELYFANPLNANDVNFVYVTAKL